MSIDRCVRCSCLVDTDDEPESYVLVGLDTKGFEDYVCFCRYHREQWEEEHGSDE